MKTMVQKELWINANVQNITGKGLEIHYKRMSNRHQIFVLKKNLSSFHSLVEQLFFKFWYQPYHGWYKIHSIIWWMFHFLHSGSPHPWLSDNDDNVETDITDLPITLFCLPNASIHSLKWFVLLFGEAIIFSVSFLIL